MGGKSSILDRETSVPWLETASLFSQCATSLGLVAKLSYFIVGEQARSKPTESGTPRGKLACTTGTPQNGADSPFNFLSLPYFD